MDLKEFISETLKQIIDGIIDVDKHFKEKGGQINPELYGSAEDIIKKGTLVTTDGGRGKRPISMVQFDVALTSAKEEGTKGGIGVFLGALGLGSQGQSSQENTSFTRIKFSVPVLLPPSP